MTLHPPTLETGRLLLRPFAISDAPRVKELAGDVRVHETTLTLPHPYEEGMAEKWISTHPSLFYNGKGVDLAITLRDGDELIGAIGLGATVRHERAELGSWIGVPYWGNGYCTEAAQAIIEYGFKDLGYHKITARHLDTNPASGRVSEKAGMLKEGTLRDEVLKAGRFHSIVVYGVITGEQSVATDADRRRR